MLLEVLKSSWVTAVGIPALLVYVQGAVKAASKPTGPFPPTFFLRPSRVPHNDRALGIDLIFAALGSQVSFLAIQATISPPPPVSPALKHLLNGVGLHVRTALDVSSLLLATCLFFLTIIAFTTRLWGHEQTSSDLREEFVTLPNMLGFVLLLVVWGVSAP
jgi:hypothetical protein